MGKFPGPCACGARFSHRFPPPKSLSKSFVFKPAVPEEGLPKEAADGLGRRRPPVHPGAPTTNAVKQLITSYLSLVFIELEDYNRFTASLWALPKACRSLKSLPLLVLAQPKRTDDQEHDLQLAVGDNRTKRTHGNQTRCSPFSVVKTTRN